MDLIRPWAIALVVWAAATAAAALVLEALASPQHLRSFSGAIGWQGGLTAAVQALTAAAGLLAHRGPEKQRRERSAAAVLGVPAATLALGAAPLLFHPDPAWGVFTACTVLAAAAAAAVWALAWWVREPVR